VPSAGALLTFAIAAFILIVIPGPSVLFSVGRAIALGRMAGIVSVAGNTIGSLVLVTAVAFGIGALIVASAVAFTVIKLAGAAYLVYLGVQSIRHRKQRADALDDPTPQPLLRVFGQAMIVGSTNPKSLAFFLAVLPQLVDKDAGPAAVQMMVFGVEFAVIAFISDSTWAMAAATARDWFASSPKRIEHLSATGGVMMIVLGGVLATARRAV
jgi:threonine/homoserine/homoserine lactone efflux protein